MLCTMMSMILTNNFILNGKDYGYKGYLSKALGEEAFDEGVELITNVHKNMTATAMSIWDKIMLRKRFIIETVNAQLKSISQIYNDP